MAISSTSSSESLGDLGKIRSAKSAKIKITGTENRHPHNEYPQLPATVYMNALEWAYLPAIFAVTPSSEVDIDDEEAMNTAVTSDLNHAHCHFARLVTLESFASTINVKVIQQFVKRVLYSLAGVVKEKYTDPGTFAPQNEKSMLQEKKHMKILLYRFRHQKFARAKRYYDRLFQRFPTFRRDCGVPDDDVLSGMGLTKDKGWPSPSATPSPSPIPSPAFVSPLPGPSPLPTPMSIRSTPMRSPPPGTPGMMTDVETEIEQEIFVDGHDSKRKREEPNGVKDNP
eukprot:CAMPEP_0184042782 /NCGR_PEP_ID=MMETSP0955-20130417/66547_1 /TAXON_ID=627963 /ORGANISM="Aplanochytrium sp, Strain PBS07" /LENGTH=283 /DNA_ID=CAMNT_0026333601 /DNA_START=352 /DNA_END=1203 /DNA_ORIENTATION=-